MNKTITSIIIIISIIIPTLSWAQSGPADFGDDPGTPIDGGASLLVGAAAVYGIKKMRDKRKQKEK